MKITNELKKDIYNAVGKAIRSTSKEELKKLSWFSTREEQAVKDREVKQAS